MFRSPIYAWGAVTFAALVVTVGWAAPVNGAVNTAGDGKHVTTASRGPQERVSDVGRSGTPSAQRLTVDERAALTAAIQDEYRAEAIYNHVLETFGNVMPFANIVQAERRHAQALAGVFERYGLAVPKPSSGITVPTFSTVAEACAAAAQAERDNVAMYDTIAANVTNPDVLRVFAALRSASQDRHLPAFERCANGGYGRNVQGQQGRQHGPRWRQGRGAQRGRGYGQGHGQGCGRGCRRGPN